MLNKKNILKHLLSVEKTFKKDEVAQKP